MDLDMNSIPEDAPVAEPLKSELDHETRTVRHHGRNILVAIDHGMDSRRAFDWALTHLLRMADTLYLLHIMPTNRKYSLYLLCRDLQKLQKGRKARV